MDTNAFVNFGFNFSPISIEYKEGNENFFEFMTYLLGLTGGLLSIIKIFNNCLHSMFYSSKKEHEEIPTVM